MRSHQLLKKTTLGTFHSFLLIGDRTTIGMKIADIQEIQLLEAQLELLFMYVQVAVSADHLE